MNHIEGQSFHIRNESIAEDETIIGVVPVGNMAQVSVQAVDAHGSARWTATGVVSLRWRNAPDAEPSDFATPKTITGASRTIEALDVSSIMELVFVVSAVEANVKINIHTWATNVRKV